MIEDAQRASEGVAAVTAGAPEMLGVVLVRGAHAVDVTDAARWTPQTWRTKHLIERLGYLDVDESCVVVDADRGVVLAMYLCAEPLVDALADKLPALHAAMDAGFERIRNRKKDNGRIVMAGLRMATFLPEGQRTGFYTDKRRGASCPRPPTALIASAAEGIAALEALLLPSSSVARSHLARAAVGDRLGVSPETDRLHGALSLGSSIGYASLPHKDVGANLPETILFDGRNVAHDAGWSFAIPGCRVVLRLRCSKHSSAFVAVPGGEAHGTPYLDDGTDGHQGIGVVIVTSEKLLSDLAQADMPGVRERHAHASGSKRRHPSPSPSTSPSPPPSPPPSPSPGSSPRAASVSIRNGSPSSSDSTVAPNRCACACCEAAGDLREDGLCPACSRSKRVRVSRLMSRLPAQARSGWTVTALRRNGRKSNNNRYVYTRGGRSYKSTSEAVAGEATDRGRAP